MWMSFLLFAENPKRTEPFLRREEDWVVVGLLMATMFAGAVAFWLIDRWRKRHTTPENRAEELTDYRAMFESGEITEEEYVRLRGRVSERVKPPRAPRPDATTGGSVPPLPPPPPPPADGEERGDSI